MVLDPVTLGVIIGGTAAGIMNNGGCLLLAAAIALIFYDRKPSLLFLTLGVISILYHLKNHYEIIEISKTMNIPHELSFKQHLFMIFVLLFPMSIIGAITILAINRIRRVMPPQNKD